MYLDNTESSLILCYVMSVNTITSSHPLRIVNLLITSVTLYLDRCGSYNVRRPGQQTAHEKLTGIADSGSGPVIFAGEQYNVDAQNITGAFASGLDAAIKLSSEW